MQTDAFWYFTTATVIFTISTVWLQITRHRVQRMNDRLVQRLKESGEDAVIADWARHTALRIVTNSGMVWSTTLAGLRTAELGSFRTWATPVSVAILPEDDARTRPLGSDRG
jgi:hypothetical protein